jgi:DNA mismatch endonuclease (patch repair protein)
MSRIKSVDTSIEILLRKALWKKGIKYRKNYKSLSGSPDIAITKYRIAIFCDGEFWHGQNWGNKKNRIKNNSAYWIKKIERNICRDNEINRLLSRLGWTVLRFWGNEIRHDIDSCVEAIMETIYQIQADSVKEYAYDLEEE